MVGRTISHYKVLSEVGRGGMGVVYKAEDTKLRRTVALKFLPVDNLEGEEEKARFLREAQAAAALNHPNICTVYEIGEADGHMFIAMEFVEGESVKEKVRARPAPLDEALDITVQAAQGLQVAHEEGIVHRDIKSANLMVTHKGQVKIMDFGLAQVGDRSDLTKTGTTLGTPSYMSPEQATAQPTDRRSDIWSLGVVFYEMLTGQLPFKGEVEAAVAYAVVNTEPEPPTALRSGLPIEIDRVLEKVLAKQREERYQHIEDLVVDLRPLHPLTGSTKKGRPELSTTAVPASAQRWERLAALITLLTLAALVGWLWNQSQQRRWALEEALPEIERLAGEQDREAAFELATRATPFLQGTSHFEELLNDISAELSIETSPPGTEVYYKPYSRVDGEWTLLGESPLSNLRLANVYTQWRVQKPNFVTIHRAVLPRALYNTFPDSDAGPAQLVRIQLRDQSEIPGDMTLVPAGPVNVDLAGLDHLRRIPLPEFLIDRYEVTNREFATFVEAGGYGKRDYWKIEFIKDGRLLSWEEAMQEFRDATGRPGPAMWELSRYPDGQADRPVGGVSWYEASAYAEFADKSLPTVYHWVKAAGTRISSYLVPLSNLAGTEPRPGSAGFAMSPFGGFDFAGNVKEWCSNPLQRDLTKRYILGGSWNEPIYMFNDPASQEAFDRRPEHGFRCIREFGSQPIESSLLEPIALGYRDYSKEKPATDEVFEVYKRFFSYDKTDLNAVVDGVDEGNEFWSRETISFDAAYGDERVLAHLLLPKRVRPPYQAVVVFPGAGAIYQRRSEAIRYDRFDYIVRSGRAVILPVYKGTYERGTDLSSDYPYPTSSYRDHVVAWLKDLARSIDYLEMRPEINSDRVAYWGPSWGGAMGVIMVALEPRIKAAVLVVGGFYLQETLPEVDQIHFAPRVKVPVLMLNGRYDHFYPVETSQLPMFRLLGTDPAHKRHILYDVGHAIPRNSLYRETLDWLDRYLGPVQ